MSTATATAETIRCPLFISGHAPTVRRLRELAAAAGVKARHAPDVTSARALWSQASTVVIGHDSAQACLQARLAPRDNVVLLTGEKLPCEKAWPLAVAMGADHVLTLPEASSFLVTRLVPQVTRRTRAPVLAVAGARRGCGTSTLAAATASAASQAGRSTMLVDMDGFGGGLDLLLGWERTPGLRWADLANMSGPFDPDKLKTGLPASHGLTLLSHSRDGVRSIGCDQLAAVLDAGRQAHELVVLDLPRPGYRPAPHLDGGDNLLVVLVPGELRAVTAARQVIGVYAGVAEQACLVTRTPSAAKLSNEQIAHAVAAPVIGSMATDNRVAAAGESARLARRFRKRGLASVAAAVLSAMPAPQPAMVS